MAKVQIIVGISGARDGVEWPKVGEFLTVPKDEADDLVRLGLVRVAEVKDVPKSVERAVAPKAETRKG